MSIRPARASDAERIAGLSGELGYAVSAADVPTRLALLSRAAHVVLVAELGREIVGWIEVGATPALVEAPMARILGLVVTLEHRGRGVGRALVAAAEAWAASKGYSKLGVTSNVVRDEAHRFYENLGFVRRKTQHVFERTIDRPTTAEAHDVVCCRTRRASIDDVSRLVALNAHVQSLHVAAHPELFAEHSDGACVQEAFAAMVSDPAAVWRIAESDEAIGYVYALLKDRPATWMRPELRVCTIQHVVVHPGYRRRGVARRLVGDVIAEAREWGFARFEIDHWSFNHEARRCFEELGFQVFNERMALCVPVGS